ncbi:hypothetical protein [Nonomuraea sp. NPDC005650]|uniref:hypothetical protein n=1 Tax=Nonomuraea sp. NPDC005650 TaxID=3157045 RepID=UPI0033A7148F
MALLTAAWLCGAPSRRAETGHHLQDFVIMPILLVLTAIGGPSLTGAPSGHTHGGGSTAALALVIGLAWTCARIIRVLPPRNADGRVRGQDMCSAGMAACMTFMAALAL